MTKRKVGLFYVGVEMNKMIRDDKVAVLYSPEWGSGWYTWNTEYPEMLFDPGIVDLIELGSDPDIIETYCTLKYPKAYLSGLADLRVVWLPIGTEFVIGEQDGYESIMLKDEVDWFTA